MDLSNLLSGTLSANANERVVSELELERLQTDPRMLSSWNHFIILKHYYYRISYTFNRFNC